MSATVTINLSKSDIKSLVKESVREALGEEMKNLRATFVRQQKISLEDRMDLNDELRLWDEASEHDFSKFVREMKF